MSRTLPLTDSIKTRIRELLVDPFSEVDQDTRYRILNSHPYLQDDDFRSAINGLVAAGQNEDLAPYADLQDWTNNIHRMLWVLRQPWESYFMRRVELIVTDYVSDCIAYTRGNKSCSEDKLSTRLIEDWDDLLADVE